LAGDQTYFQELSKELAAQRLARDGLRTRAIAVLSAGAIVFALTRTPAQHAHLDAWLLASLGVLVLIGFLVVLVLVPAPLSTIEADLDPNAFVARPDETAEQADRRFYRDEIRNVSNRIQSNEPWVQSASVFYFCSTVLLVVEIALIAAHFSGTNAYRVAIVSGTFVFLFIVAVGPFRSMLGVIRAQRSRSDLVELVPISSGRLAPPTPGVALQPTSDSPELEQAISTKQNVVDALRESTVLTLGQPAGDVVPGVGGTESDLLHYAEDDDTVALPVFTNPGLMAEPLRENPDWQTLSVLELNGKDLLDAVDDDVTIVINPQSDAEWRIPPSERA
jgi:hypothetical protein